MAARLQRLNHQAVAVSVTLTQTLTQTLTLTLTQTQTLTLTLPSTARRVRNGTRPRTAWFNEWYGGIN